MDGMHRYWLCVLPFAFLLQRGQPKVCTTTYLPALAALHLAWLSPGLPTHRLCACSSAAAWRAAGRARGSASVPRPAAETRRTRGTLARACRAVQFSPLTHDHTHCTACRAVLVSGPLQLCGWMRLCAGCTCMHGPRTGMWACTNLVNGAPVHLPFCYLHVACLCCCCYLLLMARVCRLPPDIFCCVLCWWCCVMLLQPAFCHC